MSMAIFECSRTPEVQVGRARLTFISIVCDCLLITTTPTWGAQFAKDCVAKALETFLCS